MPANRSRTERWRDCLYQIYERNGGLEIAPSRGAEQAGVVDLVWRVRIVGVSEGEIQVEAPVALGQSVPIPDGAVLTAAMSMGPNRWMFSTRVVGRTRLASRTGPGIGVLRLAMPESVERCSRRNFMRVSTASLNLPEVEVYPLLDPASAFLAEMDNQQTIRRLREGGASGGAAVLPEVGPMFRARLLNLGGGGAGLLVAKEESSRCDGSRMYWMRVNLMPDVPAPVGMCARIVHTHLDSEQNTYCGVAFEFGQSPSHRSFVIEQIDAFTRAATDARKAA